MKCSIFQIFGFFLGSVGLAIVAASDKFFFKKSLLAEGWPDHSIGYLLRSAVIFILTIIVLASLIGTKRPRQLILLSDNGHFTEYFSIAFTLFSSLLFLFLFLFKPLAFGRLCLEDGLIEWSSAVLLFGSSVLFLMTYKKNKGCISKPEGIQSSLIFLSVVFFIMAMEEISWFQRVFDIQTPELFKNSNQFEMNLHNIKTNYFENAYYFGSFIYLVVFPFVRVAIPAVTVHAYLNQLIPRPFIGVIGAVAFAYNFDMWNIVFTQISFYGSVFILLILAVFERQRFVRYLILCTLTITVATQLLFLGFGEHFARIWDVTEYKEFFIPWVFFVYAWDLFSSSGKENLQEVI